MITSRYWNIQKHNVFTAAMKLKTRCNSDREMTTAVIFKKKQAIVPPSLGFWSVLLRASKPTPRLHPGREINFNHASLLSIAVCSSIPILNLRIELLNSYNGNFWPRYTYYILVRLEAIAVHIQ